MDSPSRKTSIFLFAGEPSGDLHGQSIMQSLDHKYPMWGVGGPLMRAEGLETVLSMEDFAVMGVGAVVKALPRLLRQFYQLIDIILERKPAAVILIDYPGFCLRLMRRLRKRGYSGRIIQYVAPSVWAHGKGRIKLLEKYADLLCVIYPFEKTYFPHMAVKYVGNPLVDALPKKAKKRENILALFPGSRAAEIHNNLPELLRVAERLKKIHPELTIQISSAHMDALIRNYTDAYQLVRGEDSYALMEKARLALAVSGTATLELALRGTPSVVCYKVPKLMYAVARWIARIDLEYFCIVNILMGEEVFPEFFQTTLDEEKITTAAEQLLEDPSLCQNSLSRLKEIMGERGAGQKAAKEILSLIA